VGREGEFGFDRSGAILGAGAVAGWLAEHAPTGTPVGVAVAGTFGRGTGNLTGIAVATAAGAAAWLDPAALDEADEAAVGAWLAADDRPKVLHDAKPALLAFGERGWALPGIPTDTAPAPYLARPDPRPHDLPDRAPPY